ncbi:MAG: hypothetical protein PHI86_00550 [Candidatus Omnitrophica bacterium]|nr:hypothetical protein [Candidatus Omnitrophota bacterium]HOX54228.1 hypothetical protein [Candidatus Omnitrophota bacterium]
MFRNYYLIFIGLLLVVSGCASLNANVPFEYQPSLVANARTIDKVVGLNMLLDKRPESDIAYTKSIKDVSEKITSKLLEDFDKSKIFKEIHYPAQSKDDITINGTVDRFMWKLYSTPISYIPLLNLVIYFGVPCYESYGVADITLEIKDNRTGAIIVTLKESSKIETSYTLYDFKAGEAGAELSDAFRDVAKKLKEDILTKVSF